MMSLTRTYLRNLTSKTKTTNAEASTDAKVVTKNGEREKVIRDVVFGPKKIGEEFQLRVFKGMEGEDKYIVDIRRLVERQGREFASRNGLMISGLKVKEVLEGVLKTSELKEFMK